ncbi:hypothetical protein [uncultured Brevundimonas sp.]|uniref:hypothetical protein n=1 Tax=uncultured Brevundimonas sp. TaxID=213418 RepID=UPI0025DC2ECB|nr:hypothetical protein [uncultured Brevundimonas sp.]
MTFKPADPDEFFHRLGAKRVRKALINGEVKGDTEKKAREWLNQHSSLMSRRWAAIAFWGTAVVGILAAGATIVAAYIPS